jgi:hypothetical protein
MYRDDSINRVQFDSSAELADWLESNRCTRVQAHDIRSFYGSTTGPKALQYARAGNDSAVRDAEALLGRLALNLETSRWVDVADVAGCYPVVPEALAGEPECMRTPATQGDESAPLSVFVDLTCSGGVKAKDMRTRGVAALAAVMALAAVRPVSLEVGCVMGCDSRAPGLDAKERASIVSCRINTAPLDLATAAWLLSDVAAARRLFYGASELLHGFDGQWATLRGSRYGAVESPAYVARVRELLALPGETLYLPAVSMTEEGNAAEVLRDPLAWVEKTVAKFSGELAAV